VEADLLTSVVTSALIIIFLILSAVHVYWAVGGAVGFEHVVPHINGKPAFTPGPLVTVVVALGLLGCALFTLILGFGAPEGAPFDPYYGYAGWGLCSLFCARAVGDFKLVGFFKTVKGTLFAHYDTRYYSPLCSMLALGLAYLSAGAI